MAKYAAVAIGALAMLVVATQLAVVAPIEPQMGLIQKIFYFHVPCAMMLFLSTFVCAAGSVAYLFRGSQRGDRLALAAGELGVLFGTCVMVTGPLWARKAWGVYWMWDARLTTSLLLFLVLIAYLLARRYGGPAGRSLAAGLALFAAVDVPLIYKSVDVWRTVHPSTNVIRELDPAMKPAFLVSILAIFGVWALLLMLRLRLERARNDLDRLHIEAQDRLDAQSEVRS